MIQSYLDLNLSVNEYNKNSFDGQEREYGKIQKAYSCAHFIILAARYRGQTRYIYLGRGNNYEGFWENNKNIPSSIRLKDRYLDYIRKYLVGTRFGEIIFDDKDRIIHIPYYKHSNLGVFSIFWKGRQLYFSNTYIDEKGDRRLYLCWENLRDNKLNIDSESLDGLLKEITTRFTGIGREDLKSRGDKRNKFMSLDEYISKQNGTTTLKVFPKRKKKFFQRKQARISQDILKVQKWRELRDIAEDQEYVFPSEKEFRLLDIKFKIDKSWNQFKIRDLVFKKVKSFRAAEEILKKRLENTKSEVISWNTGEVFIKSATTKAISPEWFKGKKQKGKLNISEENVQVLEYEINGKRLAIGKTSLSNDYLRAQWAKKDDLWFHIDSMKSSHLIIKVQNISDLNSAEMELIGSIIRDMSKLEVLQIPLVFTQVKNIKGVKGKPGSVIVKKQRYLVVNYVSDWKEIIANS